MKNDKLKIYIIEFALGILFLLAMFFSNVFTKLVISIVLLVFMIISVKLIKNDKPVDINNKKTVHFMSIAGILYVGILYFLGTFQGFYNSTIRLSLYTLINLIIPYIVIISSLEIIRKNLLLKESNSRNSIIVLIIMVMLDIVIATNLNSIKTLNDYFILIGFIVFTSIVNNILYNNIVKNYKSSKSIIIYRIITTIYVYILPIVPNINILIEAITRIVIPYILYIILNSMYLQQQRIISVKSKRTGIIVSTILCIVVASFIMLVSCQFKYCALVIGSGSMTGTINKGDVVIYETYEKGQLLEENEIVVFNSDEKKVVHRIIDKNDSINGIQYYTKGDANYTQDEGFRDENAIIGVVKLKIPYIGHLTLLIKNLFKY